MSTFITKLDATSGSGTRLAVKDLIDIHGIPTTAGSRAVEQTAKPARQDAACLAGARAAGARIVGKTNLHELAMLPIGTQPLVRHASQPAGRQPDPGRVLQWLRCRGRDR
jgi:amidase